jgi:hypothetical protein
MTVWIDQFSLKNPPDGFIENPYAFYRELRVRRPVHWLNHNTVFLTRYNDVVAMYRSSVASSDKQKEFGDKFGHDSPLYQHHTTSLVFNDPPLHTRVRKLLIGALQTRSITSMTEPLKRLVNALIDRMESKRDCDFVRDFAAPIPIEVIGNLLVIPSSDRGPLRQWSLDILSALEPQPSAGVLEQGNRAVSEFSLFLKDLIAHRRQHPKRPEEDLLSKLILGEVNGERLSEHELVHQCIFLLNAGHETTTNLITNGLVCLLSHRSQWELLCGHIDLVPMAVEECLRYESPLQLNNRLLTETVELDSKDASGRPIVLPQGTFLTLGVGAANRDPEVFPEPDQFDITRKPNHQLAFGHGPHACAGMSVARLEAKIAFESLVKRVPAIELVGSPKRDPRIRFRGFQQVVVRM